MPYTYLDARFAGGNTRTSKETYTDDFEQLLSGEFGNSPTFFQIEEEYPVGSMTYQNISVRIVHAINNKTGVNLGDDWKVIMFSDPQYNVKLGTLYRFDDNIWMAYSTEALKGIATAIMVRRCNNVLRWMDLSSGYIHQVPCIIDYPIRENRDYGTAGSAIISPAGMIEVYVPFNTQSNKIVANQRFLFGNYQVVLGEASSNWTAYRVQGGGVNNFTNQNTLSNTSVGILRLTMVANYVNPETDDIANGIADAFDVDYSLDIAQSSITIQDGTYFQLYATVYRNGQIVDGAEVEWTIDDEDVAEISSTGLLHGLGDGTCTVLASLSGNDSVSDTVSITVQATSATEYEVRVSPASNTILEGETETFYVHLYKNGAVQADTFTFTVSPSSTVPTYQYVFTAIDGNSFSVFNSQRYLESPLIVACVSTHKSMDFEIVLAGAW